MGMSCLKACNKTCFEIRYFLDIYNTSQIMFDSGNIMWEYQQLKVGKTLAENWSKVAQKVGKLLAQIISPTFLC